MDELPKKVLNECKKRLLKAREDRLNGLRSLNESLSSEMKGDEADLAQSINDQNASLSQRERLMRDLKEIDAALQRMESGEYGICEETEEPIEKERLFALPWTRLSLAGAEMREMRAKRFG